MMTQKEIMDFVSYNMRNSPMIDTETGVKALKRLVALAKKENIDWALVGGIAMHFYGSPRMTKDVNVIASALLPVEAERQLGFGVSGLRWKEKRRRGLDSS